MTAIPALPVPSVTCRVCRGRADFKKTSEHVPTSRVESQEWVTALCQEDNDLNNPCDVSQPLGLADTRKGNKMRMNQQKVCTHGRTSEKLHDVVQFTMLVMSQTITFHFLIIWICEFRLSTCSNFMLQHKHTRNQMDVLSLPVSVSIHLFIT